MEPSWPVFMACSMSSASAPRDSPTMMRSGRIRRVLITRSRCVMAPAPSMFAGRVSRRTTWFCCRLQFGRVFDGDDALFFRNEARERVQHGGLARARTARDHDVQPRLHAAAHEIEHAGGEGLVLEQIFGGEQLLAVAPDRHHRPDQRERRNHRADARAVGQARVHDRRRIVDAAADGAHDAVDDHAHVRLILEADVGFHQAAGALDVDVVEAVDHDVADGGVLEQLLQRPQAEDFIENLLDELLALGHRHRQRFVDDQPLDHVADLAAHAVLVQVLELIGRQRVQQLLMDLALDLEPAVGARAGTDDARLPMSRVSASLHAVFADRLSAALAFLPPVALSTKARKTRSSSPACSRSATNGRALLIDASTAGEAGNAVEHRLIQRLLNLLQAGLVGADLLGVVVDHDLDLVLAEAHAHQEA